MRRWALLALWVASGLVPIWGQADRQTRADPPASPPAEAEAKPFRGYGFAYFLIGGVCCQFGNVLGFGAGGDALLYKGFGTSIDLGYVFPRQDVGCGIGLLTLNPSYHFFNHAKPGKLMPFVTAGYAMGFRAGAGSVVNYGGGVTWWFTGKTGLRVEVRDYVNTSGGHLVGIRTGVAFR